MTFYNWAKNQSCQPHKVHAPSSTDEVAAIVRSAAEAGRRVKAVGTGHSFTAAAMTDGDLIDLRKLNAVALTDMAAKRVTVGAGIRLDTLSAELDHKGLALPNLGDIAVQTVAGATSTATHGTGISQPNISSQIIAMEIVTGTGDVLRCSPKRNPEVFSAARVGLGALGVVTSITLQAVEAFNLEAREQVASLGNTITDVTSFLASADHAEFFWLPGTKGVQTKQNNRTDKPLAPQSSAGYFRDKILGENVAFDLIMRTARRFPSQTERMRTLIMKAGSNRNVVDKSYKVFASPRHVRFVEMEYGVPIDALSEVLERVRKAIESMASPPLFPVEVRASAGDDIPLSTGYGRVSGWVAVHRYRGIDHEPYFRMIEAIMDDYQGRPHWGKMHYQSAQTLAPRYPEWDTFMALRARLDPEGVFRNDYLDRVLGPIR